MRLPRQSIDLRACRHQAGGIGCALASAGAQPIPPILIALKACCYSTVTLLARLRGLSTLQPRWTAAW